MTTQNETTPTVAPAVDLFESSAEFLIVADVPGVADDAVDIEFERGKLRLVATRKSGEEATLEYRRTFTVSDKIDRDNISAKLEAGVLQISLPKSPELQPKKIPIKVA